MTIASERIAAYNPANFMVKLRVPEGLRYVETSSLSEVRDALESGLGVFVESCNGKAFVWAAEDGFPADQFFLGPPVRHLFFETLEEAADFASGLCEG